MRDDTVLQRVHPPWAEDERGSLQGDLPRREPQDESVLHRLADLLTDKQDVLPRTEPAIFTGDLLKFPIWRNSFEALIENKTA